MKSVWDSTVAAFSTAKTAVKGGTKKIATKIIDYNSTEDPMGFKLLFTEIKELKREAKTSENKIQVIRVNILNVANTVHSISNCSSDILPELKEYNEKVETYYTNMKRLANELLPLYAEQPFDDVIKKIKEISPLCKEASDIHESITLNKAWNKAQSAITDKNQQKYSDKISYYNKRLEELHVVLEDKVKEINVEMQKAKEKSFMAITFYFQEFIKASQTISIPTE